jgi:hypothetical protein
MLANDPAAYVALRAQDLLAEAEQDRLASKLPPRSYGVRHDLALVIRRVAAWLDEPPGYVQLPDPGPEDWVRPWVGV